MLQSMNQFNLHHGFLNGIFIFESLLEKHVVIGKVIFHH